MRILIALFLTLIGQIHASDSAYATEGWWNYFWATSEGWGESNHRVRSLLGDLDGSKETLTIVDVGCGNGRNSISALIQRFEHRAPKSQFVVHCFDFSQEALRGLSKTPSSQLASPNHA